MAYRTLTITSRSQTALAKEILKKEILLQEMELLQNQKFYNHIGNLLTQKFNELCFSEINSIASQESFDTSDYKNGFHLEIKDNVIRIYNDALVDLNKTGLSDEQKAIYGELSLASIVEYGIGAIGMNTQITTQNEDGWQYDVKNHGMSGWGYKIDGIQYWSRGYEGKLIFYKIAKYLEDNIENIIENYLKENLK